MKVVSFDVDISVLNDAFGSQSGLLGFFFDAVKECEEELIDRAFDMRMVELERITSLAEDECREILKQTSE